MYRLGHMEPDFKAHVFICTNDRGPDGKRPSCAHKGSVELRDKVKKLCKARGLSGEQVRVNSAGCLDQCERGISAVIYPQAEWHLDLHEGSAEELAARIEKLVKG